MTSERILAAGVVVLLAGAAVLADNPVFVSIWKTPDAYGARLVGKSDDDSLRVSGEEALVNELNARNIQGVASYRIAPKEELRDAARARPWFERRGIAGVVAVRPISSDVIKSYTPATWTSA